MCHPHVCLNNLEIKRRFVSGERQDFFIGKKGLQYFRYYFTLTTGQKVKAKFAEMEARYRYSKVQVVLQLYC
jgi:hypothetical protein